MSSPSLTPPVVLLLSVTAGTAVASVYFVQPLLDTIANDGREVFGEFRPQNHPIPLKIVQCQRDHLSRGVVQIQGL